MHIEQIRAGIVRADCSPHALPFRENTAVFQVVPDPCSGLRCAADEDCVVDQGQAYCQKKITSCPENESRQECGSLCEGLCLATLLGNLTCAVESVCSFPACACNKGFYRDAFGKCVVEHECFPDMRCFASPPPCKETEGCVVERGQVICVPTVTQPCGRNEVYNDCGNFCEPTCENAFGRVRHISFFTLYEPLA
ncbi:unnamed protein product [Heligmosomoides polygyrus]|uniref:TIL domain-containing protein n=1 Tax=Heligmosomoides polygyrus TaxID=6339 RepID=A0A183GEP3_HELPZ|nr:unnamed protein product [Heligmosomoides polygyrus]